MVKLKHYSRIFAIQAIYQSFIKDVSFLVCLEDFTGLISEDIENYSKKGSKDTVFPKIASLLFLHPEYFTEISAYAEELIIGVENNKKTFLDFLDKSDKKRSVDRIDYSVLAILLVAMYEIDYISDLDFRVSMDEAIELCKEYSDENSPKYVNAILQSFLEK